MICGRADVNGAALAYEIAADCPPVVLIHGFSFDMRSWDGQFAAFSERHTVLRHTCAASAAPRCPQPSPTATSTTWRH